MLLHLILISYFGRGISERNIAEDASLTYCGKKELTKTRVGGVLKINYADFAYEICSALSSIELLFKTSFSIHYILVYEGANNGSTRRGLDYFTVELKNSSGNIFPCSMYPYTSAGPLSKKSMRVNCIVNPANKIIIKSRMVIGISIAKIEAYTLIDSGKDILTIYHGCFKDFTSDKQTKLTQWSDCLTQCSKQNYVFAAIKNNEECHCGEIPFTSKSLPLKQCDIRCGTNFCGGRAAFSIYIVNIQLPYFNGCFAKSSLLKGYTINGDMTVSKCIKRCYNFTFAALTKGDDCLCTDEDFALTFDNYYSCNVQCTGELSKTCGGENYFALYGTKSHKRRVKWLNIFRCKQRWDEFGLCGGGCEADYLTSYCTTIDAKHIEAITSITTSRPTSLGITKTDQTTSSVAVRPKFHRFINPIDPATHNALAQQTDSTSVEAVVIEENMPASSGITTTDQTTSSTSVRPKSHRGITKTDQTTSSISVRPKSHRPINPIDPTKAPPEALVQQYPSANKADKNFCTTGDECKDELNTECISRKTTFECICLLGYYKGDDKSCSDVNECDFPMCDPSTTMCENTVGSYLCRCKPGHFRIASHICLNNVSEPLLFALTGEGISTFFIIVGLCGFFAIAIMICVMAPPVTEEETEMPAPSPVEDDVPSN